MPVERGSALAALTEHDLLLVDSLAERVAELLRPAPSLSPGLLTAAQLAQALNVSRAWVYENAGRLGALKLGDGPRARLRFDLETARAGTRTSGVKDAPRPARRPRGSKTEVGRVLAVRPPRASRDSRLPRDAAPGFPMSHRSSCGALTTAGSRGVTRRRGARCVPTSGAPGHRLRPT